LTNCHCRNDGGRHARWRNCRACGGDKPGDPEVEESYSLEGVFEWLQDCLEQIERAVIAGGLGTACEVNLNGHP